MMGTAEPTAITTRRIANHLPIGGALVRYRQARLTDAGLPLKRQTIYFPLKTKVIGLATPAPTGTSCVCVSKLSSQAVMVYLPGGRFLIVQGAIQILRGKTASARRRIPMSPRDLPLLKCS